MNEGRELIRHVDGTAFFRSPLDLVQEPRAVRITGPKGGPYEPHIDIPIGSLIPLRRAALRLSGPP